MNVSFPAERTERPLKKTEKTGGRMLFKECWKNEFGICGTTC